MTTKTITRRRRVLAVALGALIALTGATGVAAGATVKPPQTGPFCFD